MTNEPPKPLQFSLKWLFALPVAIGLLISLYSAGLPSELLFYLTACPLILAFWLVLTRFIARLMADFFD